MILGDGYRGVAEVGLDHVILVVALVLRLEGGDCFGTAHILQVHLVPESCGKRRYEKRGDFREKGGK